MKFVLRVHLHLYQGTSPRTHTSANGAQTTQCETDSRCPPVLARCLRAGNDASGEYNLVLFGLRLRLCEFWGFSPGIKAGARGAQISSTDSSATDEE